MTHRDPLQKHQRPRSRASTPMNPRFIRFMDISRLLPPHTPELTYAKELLVESRSCNKTHEREVLSGYQRLPRPPVMSARMALIPPSHPSHPSHRTHSLTRIPSSFLPPLNNSNMGLALSRVWERMFGKKEMVRPPFALPLCPSLTNFSPTAHPHGRPRRRR